MNTTVKVAFWWVVFFNIVDAALTAMILQAGGDEVNPIMLSFINSFGLMGLVYGKIPGLVVMGLVVYMLWGQLSDRAQRFTHGGLVTLTMLMSALTVYSSVVLYNLAG